MSRTPQFEAWVQQARDADILEEALAHGAQLKRHGHEWTGPCPLCGGKDRFSINTAKAIFNCRGSVGGDVIRMVEHIEAQNFLGACESINRCPPPDGRSRQPSEEELRQIKIRRDEANRDRRARQEMAERANRRAAGELWREARQIASTPAEVYLHHRGIPTPREGWPDCFRFHPALAYPQQGRMPALLCRADNVKGIPVAIWRIYLAPDGRGKARVPNAKLGLGSVAGAAVRIGGEGPHLGIAEGVETALGAWYLTGRVFPVWAGLSTSGVSGFQVPEGVSKITIFSDGDKPIRRKDGEYVPAEPPGRAAARKLQERLHSQSIPCVIASEPPAGADYLDLFVQSQRSAA